MKDKIVNWFRANWKPIGYTVGIINIMSGLADIATGNMFGAFWVALGSFIVYDARTST